MDGQMQHNFIEDVYNRVTTSAKKLFANLQQGQLLEDGSITGKQCPRCRNQATLSDIHCEDSRPWHEYLKKHVQEARELRMGDESDDDYEEDPVQWPSGTRAAPPFQSSTGRNSSEQLNSTVRQGDTLISAPLTNLPTFNPGLLMPQQPASSTPASLQHQQNFLPGNQATSLSSSHLVQQPTSLSSPHLVQQPTSLSSSYLVQQPTSLSSSHLVQQPTSLSSPHLVQQPTSLSSSHLVQQPTSLSSSHLVQQPTSLSSPHFVQQPTSLSSSHLVQQPTSLSSSHLVQQPKSLSSPHLAQQPTYFGEHDHPGSHTRPHDLQPGKSSGVMGKPQLVNTHKPGQPSLPVRNQTRSGHSATRTAATYKATTSLAAQKVLAQLSRVSSLDQHPYAQTVAFDSMQPYTTATRVASASQGIRNLRSDRGYISGGSSWMQQEEERNIGFSLQTYQRQMDHFEDHVSEPNVSPYQPGNRVIQFDMTSDDFSNMDQDSAALFGDAYGSYPTDGTLFPEDVDPAHGESNNLVSQD